MTKAWIVESKGSIGDSLKLTDITLPKLGPTDILIKHKTLGLNDSDILQQYGVYPLPENKVLGCEVAGTIEDLGSEIQEFRKGDRVAYATTLGGGCAEYSVVDRAHVVPVPNYISTQDAAALLKKGMLAHMLLKRTYFANNNTHILINNAATGLGRLIATLGKHYEAKTMVTCHGRAECESIKLTNPDLIIDITTESFVQKVMDYTQSKGANVIYDFFGSKTFEQSIECIAFFGLLVNLENSYLQTAMININKLFDRGTFVTSPILPVYKQIRQELILSSNEVFALCQQQVIKADITKYEFSDIKQAYKDLASGKVLGQAIIEI